MKKIVTIVAAFIMVISMMGCGKKSDEELIQGTVWHLEEVSSELPEVFPKSGSNGYLGEYFFNVEFLSDGSVIIDAKSDHRDDYESVGYFSYSLVDGRLKISAPLGTTCLVNYELSKNSLKVIDGDNYAIFKPYDENDAVEKTASAKETVDDTISSTEGTEDDIVSSSEETAGDVVTSNEDAADAVAYSTDEVTNAVVSSDNETANEVTPATDAVVEAPAETTETIETSDHDPSNNGMNKFWSPEDVYALWQANTYGPGCYQPEIGIANEDFAWGVVEGDLHTTINVKLKDGYSFADMKPNMLITPEMLDVSITNAHYTWYAQEEGDTDYEEPLPDVTIDPKDITINNPCFVPDNPYIQLIIPDMYNAYTDVEAGQYYVVNWEYGKDM
ncbi:hypothetical protein [Butyrivibrio sp. AC2005]|uniref:hypothetical protein n=1 Tax=Butyrivibrio sp. AC2005 TaxID=1280672 RepID=UPI0004055B79|nr:hypothetical protein [Butyrivibrio sp. AC2005]